MSSAFYPLGMKTYNNHVPQGGYKSWKGSGPFSNPVGTASSHIRPLTNNDSGNVFQTGFGLARPIKHYRKGRVIPAYPITVVDPSNPTQYIEQELINYNMNRFVASSKGASLGGGAGGRGLLNEMMDNPGSYIVKQNTVDENGTFEGLQKECQTCEGVGIIASYYPNTTYLTENPENNTQNATWCCNPERKARRRTVYASTILKKNYYTTTKQYLQNRCQTYDQKAFNFQQPNPVKTEVFINSPISSTEIAAAKPGSALATFNTYVANCFPNAEIFDATEDALIAKLLNILLNKGILTQEQVTTFINLESYNFDTLFNYLSGLPAGTKTASLAEFVAFINNPYWGVPFAGPSNPNGCKLTVYKPNNPQFAQQGAVSSSTRMLKLNVDTISTNAATFNKRSVGTYLNINDLVNGSNGSNAFILKNKAPPCNSPPIIQHQNKKACHLSPSYNLAGIPSQPVFSSNHFAQSPVNPLM